ncbi:MAG: 50S ribosomal protein L29 [Candidatus Aenigmarchaeota archaeon]|nr:50S ribosomal protein L29 [Candidatus Aenigmarchaeota archaeon]
MALLKTKDARVMKADERLKRLGEFRLELAKLKGSSAVGASIKQPGKVKELRKAIARMLTIGNEEKSSSSKVTKEKMKNKGGKEA